MESRKLSIRVTQLEGFLAFVSSARTEIRYSALPVEQILEKHGRNLRFLELCGIYYSNGEEFSRAWNHGLEKGTAGTGLREKELGFMRDFGQGFGATDLEGQLSHCQLYLDLIGGELTQAKEEKAQKSKLYFMLGIFGGLAAALLIV